MPGTRKLGRASDHRKSMLRGLVTYLLENGRIETTVTRAQEVRAMAEKMITIAKDDSLHSKRKVMAYVTKEDVVKKLFDEIAPKYKDVNAEATPQRWRSSSWFDQRNLISSRSCRSNAAAFSFCLLFYIGEANVTENRSRDGGLISHNNSVPANIL